MDWSLYKIESSNYELCDYSRGLFISWKQSLIQLNTLICPETSRGACYVHHPIPQSWAAGTSRDPLRGVLPHGEKDGRRSQQDSLHGHLQPLLPRTPVHTNADHSWQSYHMSPGMVLSLLWDLLPGAPVTAVPSLWDQEAQTLAFYGTRTVAAPLPAPGSQVMALTHHYWGHAAAALHPTSGPTAAASAPVPEDLGTVTAPRETDPRTPALLSLWASVHHTWCQEEFTSARTSSQGQQKENRRTPVALMCQDPNSLSHTCQTQDLNILVHRRLPQSLLMLALADVTAQTLWCYSESGIRDSVPRPAVVLRDTFQSKCFPNKAHLGPEGMTDISSVQTPTWNHQKHKKARKDDTTKGTIFQ